MSQQLAAVCPHPPTLAASWVQCREKVEAPSPPVHLSGAQARPLSANFKKQASGNKGGCPFGESDRVNGGGR